MGKKEQETQRRGTQILFDYMEMIAEMLTKEEQADIYADLLRYAREGRVVKRPKASRVYKSLLKSLFSADDEMRRRYEETCERNRKNGACNGKRKAASSEGDPLGAAGSEWVPAKAKDKVREDKIREERAGRGAAASVLAGRKEATDDGMPWY